MSICEEWSCACTRATPALCVCVCVCVSACEYVLKRFIIHGDLRPSVCFLVINCCPKPWKLPSSILRWGKALQWCKMEPCKMTHSHGVGVKYRASFTSSFTKNSLGTAWQTAVHQHPPLCCTNKHRRVTSRCREQKISQCQAGVKGVAKCV